VAGSKLVNRQTHGIVSYTAVAEVDRLPPSSGRRSEFSGSFLCSFFLL